MIFFVTCLRALAACLITNAHYTGIYPIDLIANGGLIGDILFFAVSGYCLYNVKTLFPRWYGKRIYRVYPPVLIMTAIYVILGFYSLEDRSAGWWFIYPTYYHFVASIIVLYIPFYFIMKIRFLKERILSVMGIIAVVWLLIYFTVYDNSYYHIDTVREPMIRFLFIECMLLGAWFRQNDEKVRNKFKAWHPIATAFVFCVYFASKILFSHRESLASFQILNQIAIFALLILIFITFAGLDNKLEKLPDWIKKAINFVSDMTLEIYVVQYVLIELIRPVDIFPLNWVLLTASILGSAFILHKITEGFYHGIKYIASKSVCVVELVMGRGGGGDKE